MVQNHPSFEVPQRFNGSKTHRK